MDLAYWLFKSDPEEYSYDNLEKDGKTVWNGVTNNLALKHLRSVKKGDQAFIYHTGSEKRIVAIADVTSEPYPDPGAKNPNLVVVDLKPKNKLGKTVSLEQLKAIREFAGFELIRLPRLSVMPVDGPTWRRILQLSGP